MEPIARIRLSWDPELTRCRATAVDLEERVLGEVMVDMPPHTAQRIHARGSNVRFRLEDLVERHLRAVLQLRG